VTLSTIRHLNRNVPRLDESEVRSAVLKHYSLDGQFQALTSERDQNFDVRSNDGRRFVLRIANIDEKPGDIDFQLSALQHIAEMNPSLPVPRPLLNSNGQALTEMSFGDGESHLVHILSYMDGSPLENLGGAVTLDTHRNLGKLIARVDLALSGFFHPAADQDHPWSMGKCTRLLSMVEHLGDADAREMITKVFKRMDQDILPRVRRCRHQVIHQDAHAGNVLVDPNDPTRICGLIDFGDMLYGSLVAEVAVAADFIDGSDDSLLDVICETAAGYDSVNQLDEDEIDLVFDMIVARNALAATIASARASLMPDEPAHVSDPQACIDRVDKLLTIGFNKGTKILRRACRFPVYCPVSETESWSIAVKTN
jgi:Ser/Thr protein kinase RdoA (MazF antagonist)